MSQLHNRPRLYVEKHLYGGAALLVFMTIGLAPMNTQAQSSNSGGQLLIKYENGTNGSAVVDEASRTVPLDLSPLEPVIDKLSNDTGIPLTVHALNSGGWLTLSLDVAKMNKQLYAFLAEHDHVASAQITDPPVYGPAPVRVRFKAGTKEAEETKALTRTSPGKTLNTLTERIEKALAIPIHVAASNANMLDVSIDMKDLTRRAVEKLQKQSAIKHAQPNHNVGY